MNPNTRAILYILIIFTAAAAGWGNSNGTFFQGVTGAPGETTCADCHDNLNTGSGSVVITAPDDYTPGDTVEITVSINDAGQTRWGFEFTALDASDQPAGTIIVTDIARTVSTTALNGRQYIAQTTLGTDATKGNSTQWSFDWITPESNIGPVTFYVASVAGDEASGPNGDYTYTTTHTMLATSVVEVAGSHLPGDFSLEQNYPNPFNPVTAIEFSLPTRAKVELTVFNIIGQKVRVLHSGILEAGQYRTEWNGTDYNGRQAATGAYFYRLETASYRQVRKMILLK